MPEVPPDRPDADASGTTSPAPRARRTRAKAATPDGAVAEATTEPRSEAPAKPKRARATKAVAPPEAAASSVDSESTSDVPTKTTRTRRRSASADSAQEPTAVGGAAPAADPVSASATPPPRSRRRTTTAAAKSPEPGAVQAAPAAELAAVVEEEVDETSGDIDTPDEWAFAANPIAAQPTRRPASPPPAVAFTPPKVTFAAPVTVAAPDDDASIAGAEADRSPRTRSRRPRIAIEGGEPSADLSANTDVDADESADSDVGPDADEAGERGRSRRRRGRRGRGRGKGTEPGDESGETGGDAAPDGEAAEVGDGADGPGQDSDDGTEAGGTRRRRRRRRGGSASEGAEPGPDDPPRTVVRVREPREPREPRKQQPAREDDGVRGVGGSTRLEAKRQRRRDGRSGSRRPSIVTESEFLARREAVERTMLVRQTDDRTQIAVLEDGVLVEHYVTKASATSYAGNVYLGRVQNVLPSMEAAFVDVGKGRNAVLYAGEVNYDASALEGRAPRIEQALKSGQQVMVQVTKDPIGHKGARLTSQISLPGRYMVYVPEQSMTGISRKLPDTERARLKSILKALKPEGAGIIIRTAAEGASEEDLTRDLERLKAQWEVIEKKAKKESAPALLHAEPDLVIKVIRDNFNEDFHALVVEAGTEYDLIEGYLSTLAPDLLPRLTKYDGDSPLFESYRVNEQLQKALDRKVSLPSGGSLVIDRTEAMTVVDVNTGKFTGKGGNLEETVTRNNLEAAEEIVRQLRLRDIGGIIVVDFIDMILESNRELVTRRLTECLGRDRTKHQVAEITSLGLLQMTRKRISQGLLESFSDPCPECAGRGVVVHQELLAPTPTKGKGRRGAPSPAAVAAAASKSRHDNVAVIDADADADADVEVGVEASVDIELVDHADDAATADSEHGELQPDVLDVEIEADEPVTVDAG